MALNITRAKVLPIGVDMGSAMLKMVQMRHGERGLELVAAGSVEIPRACRSSDRSDQDAQSLAVAARQRNEFIGRAIRSLVKSKIFKGDQAVLSLPAEQTFVHHMKIPKLPPVEVPGALRWELRGKLPYPVEDGIIRHMVAGDVFGDGDAKQEVIAVASAKATVDACLSMARRAKLDVVGLNVESCAIVECFARMFDQTAGTMLYVDIGAASTQVVLARSGAIVFARNLTIGGDAFDEALAATAGVNVEEAGQVRRDHTNNAQTNIDEETLNRAMDGPVAELADQLTQCLRYHESVFRGQAAERVIFLGGQAYDKRLCQAIAQQLNLPAQIGDPLAQVSKTGAAALAPGLEHDKPQPDWAVAVGLSLGASDAA